MLWYKSMNLCSKLHLSYPHVDINECSADSSLCDQICENTVGSYSCNCYTGFMLTGSQCQGND